MRPKATNIGANIPAFLSKLWKIVNDPDTDHLICWSPDGRSFVIQNQAQFWYNLLPIYYKHNNMSSFIRQLNMYGFHKMSSDNGGMDCDKDEIKFFHPFFQQDQPNLMKHIKRKMASSKTSPGSNEDNKVTNVDQISKVLVDVKQLRGRQESVDNQLAAMKQENAALWRELALLRQKHMKQQQIVNKLIHFLVTIVQPSRSGLGGLGVKRRYPLMINDSRYSKVSKTDATSDGPTIHELDSETALTDTLLLDEVTGEELIDNSENQVNADSPQSLTNRLMEPSNVLLDIPIIEDNENSTEELNSDILLDQDLTNTDNQSNVADLLAETDLSPCTSATNVDFPMKDTDLQEVISDKDILQAANEYMDLSALDHSSNEEAAFEESPKSTKHILNPNMRDAMISNLVSDTLENEKSTAQTKTHNKSASKKNMTVATRNIAPDLSTMKLSSVDGFFSDDLDSHLETTQGELDSIKEMLFDGYSLDANALLGNQSNNRFDAVPLQLFNPEEDFPLDVPPLTVPEVKNENNDGNYDPMMSGSEIMTYNNPPFALDFENLFEYTPEDTVDGTDETLDMVNMNDDQINTPVVVKKEPTFPTIKPTNAK